MRKLVEPFPFVLKSAAVAALTVSLPALAALITPVSVNLIAQGGYTSEGSGVTTPINVTQNLGYGTPITTITPPIGAYLITGELVELIGDSIHIRSGAGDTKAPGPNNLRTGLLGSGGSDKARYVFSGLGIAGANITGYSISTLDTSGAGAGTFSGVIGGTTFLSLADTDANGSFDKLTFNLEDLRFVSRLGLASPYQNFADFTISLISTPITVPPPPPPPPAAVPEPASLLLVLAALASVGATRRLRPAVRSPAPRPPGSA